MEFLTDYRLLFLTLHILCTAIGLGGATISDLLFFKFLKDHRVSTKEAEVLHLLKDVIMTAMIIIIASGVALYLPAAETLNTSPLFLAKATIVFIVFFNGIALHLWIAPYLIHLNLRNKKRMGGKWYRLAFALGAVSIISWYTTFFIAMLKSAMPFSYMQMMTIYLSLLLAGIFGSQIMEKRLTIKATS